jgi:hypothetical protein
MIASWEFQQFYEICKEYMDAQDEGAEEKDSNDVNFQCFLFEILLLIC